MAKTSSWIQSTLNPDPFRFSSAVVPEYFKPAAVLLPVWQGAEGLMTLVTKRSSKLKKHGGEVCFPGGKLEPGETFGQAAVREMEEEIGIAADSVNLLGRLDDAWSGAGFHIEPHVGFLETDPTQMLTNQAFSEEVESVIAVNLEKPLEIEYVSWKNYGKEYMDPVIQHESARIYGLTADMLLELVDQLKGKSHNRGQVRMDFLELYSANQS